MIALAVGIATGASAALQRMIPDYTASLQADAGEACETGACDPEAEVEARGDFAQCARGFRQGLCGASARDQRLRVDELPRPALGTVTLVDLWSSSLHELPA